MDGPGDGDREAEAERKDGRMSGSVARQLLHQALYPYGGFFLVGMELVERKVIVNCTPTSASFRRFT